MGKLVTVILCRDQWIGALITLDQDMVRAVDQGMKMANVGAENETKESRLEARRLAEDVKGNAK